MESDLKWSLITVGVLLIFLGGMILFFRYEDIKSDAEFSANLKIPCVQFENSSTIPLRCVIETIYLSAKNNQNLNFHPIKSTSTSGNGGFSGDLNKEDTVEVPQIILN